MLADSGCTGIPAGEHSVVGVDVLGPGGGQFTVAYGPTGIVGVAKGLPNDNVPLLRVSLDDLQKIREQPELVAERLPAMLEQLPQDATSTVAAELLESLSKDSQLTSAG